MLYTSQKPWAQQLYESGDNARMPVFNVVEKASWYLRYFCVTYGHHSCRVVCLHKNLYKTDQIATTIFPD